MAAEKIDPKLLESLRKKEAATIILHFEDTIDALKKLDSVKFKSREERLQSVNSTLTEHANRTQKRVKEFLDEKIKNGSTINWNSKWIDNSLVIKNTPVELVEELIQKFDEIVEVDEDKIVASVFD